MRMVDLFKGLLVVIVSLFVIRCGVGDDSSDDKTVYEISAQLQNVQFISEEKHETGLGEDGEILGYWHVTFKEGKVCWDYSDISEDCHAYAIDDAGHISATFGTGNWVEGDYDSVSGRLKWDGLWYKPVAYCGSETLLPPDEDGNFVLYVSNQSFSITPVDIMVYIDGQIAVCSDFEVGNQHNWIEYRFGLTTGSHMLVALSVNGGTETTEEFEIADGTHWAVIDYWYSPEENAGKHFSFYIQNDPIYFQ